MTRAYGSPKVHQDSVRDRKLQAFIGGRHSRVDALDRNYVNQNPQAQQVSTLTVDSYSAGADYVFSFNGVDHTVVGAGGTTTTVAEDIAEYMENEGGIYGFVSVSQAAAVVTLTGRNPGYSFDLDDDDAKLTSADTTSAADAAAVPFGSAVVSGGYATGSVNDVEDAVELGRLAEASGFTAQVDTWTIADPGTGQIISASVAIKGLDEIIRESQEWDTDLDTTLDHLAVLLNAALTDLGYNAYVTVAGPAGDPGAGELAFTAAIAGAEFASMVTCDDVASYPAITVASNKAFATSLHKAFAGVALRVSDEEADLDFDANSVGSWSSNATMLIAERGEIWVDNADSLSRGEQVFVDLTAADAKFYNAAGTDRIPLDLSRAEWLKSGRSLDGETLGLLRLK